MEGRSADLDASGRRLSISIADHERHRLRFGAAAVAVAGADPGAVAARTKAGPTAVGHVVPTGRQRPDERPHGPESAPRATLD